MSKLTQYFLASISIFCGLIAAFYSQASSINYRWLFSEVVLPLYILQLAFGFLCIRKGKKIIRVTMCIVFLLSGVFVVEMAARVFL